MFGRISSSSNDDSIKPKDDYNSRMQRWGDTMAKIEASFTKSAKDDENRMVLRGNAAGTASSSAALFNPYFNVLAAPGTSYHANSVARFSSSSGTYARRGFSEWIRLQKMRDTGDVAETKRYFERAVRMVNSLVLKVVGTVVKDGRAEYEVTVHPKLISSDNLLVQQSAEEGDSVHLVQSETEDDSNLGDVATKYAAMKALGVVAYELMMRGAGPPIAALQPSAYTDKGGQAHLILSIDDTVDGGVIERGQAKRNRSASRGSHSRITTAMVNAGVPFPLCRFVIDLIGGESCDGLLFRRDDSFQSFTDILADLKQMMENPEAFIHLSVRDQWRLAFGDKLHGRSREKKLIMDVACKVSGTSSNDALFEALALLLPQNKQQVVMVTGQPGSGKSRLVMETRKSLENQGWLFLSCKFDRIVHAEPLSIMASAFDEFLEQSIGLSRERKIREHLCTVMQPDEISLLSKHVPALAKYVEGSILPQERLEVCKEQMHQLFSQLLEVLSGTGHPICYFMDDCQWCDSASLALFMALTKADELDLSGSQGDSSKKPNVLFICSYRDTEVDSDHQLTQSIDQLNNSTSVEVTNVAVRGFDVDTLNKIISESLCLPLRKTKSLSEIIQQKTDGIVIHIIEFIGRLTTERIICHSFIKGWEWSSEDIEGCSISESVAELFSFKLKHLPGDALLGLQICSIFGTHVEKRIINLVHDYDGDESVDIDVALKTALELGLVETTGSANVLKFAHDIISQAAFDMIKNEQTQLLQKLASALIRNATAANQIESVTFIIVDLINRIENSAVTDPSERILFASLNARAGEKALAVPDFSSAVKYTDSGLLFLPADHWQSHRDLSLSLCSTSVAALYSCKNGNRNHLKERIDAVLQNVKSLQEELKTRYFHIMILSTTSVTEAIQECHILLERLGEPIDVSDNDRTRSLNRLVKAKESYLGSKQQFSVLDKMTDSNKLFAMKIMTVLQFFYHYSMSHLRQRVCTRMLEMSLSCGHCEDTVFGLACFSAMVVFDLGDIEDGCEWARATLTLASKSRQNALLPAVYAVIYGFALVWKEPLQATLEKCLYGCRLGFYYGNLQFAISNAQLYVVRSFHCGKNIDVFLGELELLCRKSALHGQLPFIQFYLTPIYNVLRGLKGLDKQVLAPLEVFADNDELRARAMKEADPLTLKMHIMFEIVQSFLLRNMEKVQSMVAMINDDDGKDRTSFHTVIINFFAGLTACYFARQTRDEELKAKARNTRDKLGKLLVHSTWNFENKWYLMKAECCYADGEIGQAATNYQASINSARSHRLIHEEAIACELAAHFYKEQRDEPKSMAMFKQAREAYLKWGADEKAKTLRLEGTVGRQYY